MKKNILILVIVALVILGVGGMLVFQGKQGKTSTPKTRVTTRPGVGENAASGSFVETANYKKWDRAVFDLAKDQGKVVMLYFTANWCPTCAAQEPTNKTAFETLEADSEIVAFRIHILDSDTTKDTEALADEYGVRLQHTFVVLDTNGSVFFTHTGPLVEKDIVETLLAAKQV